MPPDGICERFQKGRGFINPVGQRGAINVEPVALEDATLPLYRQAQIYSREGVDLDRSTLADWVGRAGFELRPGHDALMADLKRSTKLFMDETRAPVLDPGARKTKTGYFWALARDDRPWGGASPPGVVFTYVRMTWLWVCG